MLDLPVLVPPPAGTAAAPIPARLIIRRKPCRRGRAVTGAGDAQGGTAGPCRPTRADRGRRHLMVMTTLPPGAMDADAVCALCRLRWQIELALERLESLMGLEDFVAREPRLARATVAARLILAILAESLIGRVLALSPSG